METSSSLGRLLSPLSCDLFLENYFGRRWLHQKNRAAKYYEEIVCVEDLDTLLQNGLLPAALFNVVSAGKRIPVEEWSTERGLARGAIQTALPSRLFEHYHAGATLVVNEAHRVVPSLGVLCRALASELQIRTQANVYITPPSCRGFARHEDEHDVLVLQIAGSKGWVVYHADETCEAKLHCGDLLYLPRGTSHEARAADEASVHVTVGLHAGYAFHLLKELAEIAESDLSFRIPLSVSGGDGVNPAAAKLVAAFVGEHLAARRGSDLLARRRSKLKDTQHLGIESRLTTALDEPRITLDSVLQCRREVLRTMDTGPQEVSVCFAGQTLKVPRFLAPCLEQVLSDKPFPVRSLTGLIAENAKVDFVRPFVRAGLLRVVSLR